MTLLRKISVAILGGTLLLIGVAMLVLPGPAIVVIPAALAILAIEFVWARRWLQWLRERVRTFSRSKTRVGEGEKIPEPPPRPFGETKVSHD